MFYTVNHLIYSLSLSLSCIFLCLYLSGIILYEIEPLEFPLESAHDEITVLAV